MYMSVIHYQLVIIISQQYPTSIIHWNVVTVQWKEQKTQLSPIVLLSILESRKPTYNNCNICAVECFLRNVFHFGQCQPFLHL